MNIIKSATLNEISRISHGFFTKNGGVSSGVYTSLNCSLNSNDLHDKVLKNRQLVMQALCAEKYNLYGLHQIHSTKVYVINKNMPPDIFREGDAMVTNEEGVFLSVLGADCTPILFSDSTGSVIGAAHAGWRGAVTGIVEAVVLRMCELGAVRKEITACLGPTIHQSSYEVKQDFLNQLIELSAIPSKDYINKHQDKYYFDLPSYLLAQCDRSEINAEDIGLDTYSLKNDFFSFRRNTHLKLKDYGRQISVIGRT